MPRVSIITATYNRASVLRWTIESVQAQSFQDWEHIVIGDACTDDTGAVVAGFGDPRRRFVNQAENFGEQSGPNNEGLRLARGEYVAFLNHDDLWFPDHLETLLARFETSGADLVYAPTLHLSADGRAFLGETNAELRYAPSHFVPASLWLVKRELAEALGGWRAARDIDASNPSQDFLVRAWRSGARLVCSPAVTAIMLPSGGRPGCYSRSSDAEHAALFTEMQRPDFRRGLIESLALVQARRIAELNRSGFRARMWRLAERLMIMLRMHPDAVRNRLTGKPRGHWISRLRALRGLAALPEAGPLHDEAQLDHRRPEGRPVRDP